ncbi:hypothetical protein LOY37_13935 [Pseudomonas sp. B21-012]|uniref:hypothetical protein n=1 Tax=Pseudomonas sp. B21-012 TaxID=2895472 RepID=UPI002160C5E5|nr:hypothetical protein [Pseudomonas sp. B21-012]UVM53480.1 hypothetical protein LOY37_13935 [Pseudomonas sp. B21-012]
MALYGFRTREAAGVVTFDTSVTPIRSLKMMTVTGDGSFDQYISIPEIQAQSFVVVDTLADQGEYTYSPAAWYSAGTLQLRQPLTNTWQVMILSQGGEPFTATGSYGIRSRNDNIRMQIDAVNRVLSVRHSGSFQFGQQVIPGQQAQFIQWADINFPAPITTSERPLVFLNAVDYMMVGNFSIKGSPGNWTGFRLKAWPHPLHGSAWQQFMTIKWFCSSYMADSSPVGQYGISVRDANGVRLFSTSTNITSLNSQPANNSFVQAGDPISGSGSYSPSQQMPWTGSYDDYVLANALFTCTNVVQTTQPIRANFGGFWPGNRGMLQMYVDNGSGINPLTANGRTLFAARPMKPI